MQLWRGHFVSRRLLRWRRDWKSCNALPVTLLPALMLLFLMLSVPTARADAECGADGAGADSLTCSANSYPSGITYPGSDGLTLDLNNPAMTVGNDGVIVTGTGSHTNAIVITGTAFDTIITTNPAKMGIYAFNQALGAATANLISGSITTLGDSSNGMRARILNASNASAVSVFMGGGSITTNGNSTAGIYALTNGSGTATARISGGTITMNGTSGTALHAHVASTTSTADADAIMQGGVVTTNGSGSRGLYGLNAGLGDARVTVDAGTVQINGSGSDGLSARVNNTLSGATAAVSVSGGTITASGANSDAIQVENSGSGAREVSVDGATVTGGSGTGVAIQLLGDGAGTVTIGSTATIDGTASGTALRDGATLATTGGATAVTMAGTMSGDVVLGMGDDSFALTGGTLTGNIYGDDRDAAASNDGITSNEGDDSFTWSGGQLIGGFFGQDGSDTATIGAGAGFDGSQTLNGGDDADSADGMVDTLTLNGVTATVAGARLLNWEVIDLSASTLSFSDTALTVGDDVGTGLRLSNSSTVNLGSTFALSGDLAIDSSSQFLARGSSAGLLSVTGTIDNDGLMSLADSVVGDVLTVTGDYTGTGVLALDTDLATGSADTLSINGDATGRTRLSITDRSTSAIKGGRVRLIEVSGTTAADAFYLSQPLMRGLYLYDLQALANDWYLTASLSPDAPVYENYLYTIGLLNRGQRRDQRLGSRQFDDCPDGAEDDVEGCARQALRITTEGTTEKRDTSSAITQSMTDSQSWMLRGTIEIPVIDDQRGRLTLVSEAFVGKASTAIEAEAGNGSIASEASGTSLTAAWDHPSGFYADLQGRLAWFDSNLRSSSLGSLVVGNDGLGGLVSVEVGQRLSIAEDFTLAPQAQLTYSTLSFDSFVPATGGTVAVDDGRGLAARLGLHIERTHDWTSASGTGRRISVYGIANLTRELIGDTSILIGGVPVAHSRALWTGEFGLGGVMHANDDGLAFGGDVSVASAIFGSSYDHSLKGNFWMRKVF
jgi:outer membrane autotransporter protein